MCDSVGANKTGECFSVSTNAKFALEIAREVSKLKTDKNTNVRKTVMTTLNQLKEIAGVDLGEIPPNPADSRLSQNKKMIEDKRNYLRQAKEKNLEKKRDTSPGFGGDQKQEKEKRNYGINRKNINPAFMKQDQSEQQNGDIEIFVNEN